MSGQNTDKNTGNLMPPWPKGVSGNPGGRPKKKPVSDMYEEIMSDRENLRRFCLAQFEAACKGDTAAARDITDRLEGKPLQSVDVSDNRKHNGAERLAELFAEVAGDSSEAQSGKPQ